MATRTKIAYATVAGIEFQEETVAAARALGERQIAAFVHEANLGPSVYRVHALTVLIMPQIDGWAYRILLDGDRGGLVHWMCNMGGTRVDCVTSAVSHAAMYQWDVEMGDALTEQAWLTAAFAPARDCAEPEGKTHGTRDHAVRGLPRRLGTAGGWHADG